MKNFITPLLLLSLILAVGCSKKSSIPEDHNSEALSDNDEFFAHPEEMTAYSQSPLTDKLKACAFARSENTLCKINEAPLIGIGKGQITVQDILNKTFSTSPSYIETFRNALMRMPKESLSMFGAVNAIMISERIIPSFYTYTTGAIYLSSTFFWKSIEGGTLVTKKDYRADYGNALQFMEINDYIKNNTSLYAVNNKKIRTDDELTPYIFRVLMHELSHANDFFPQSFYNSSNIDQSKSYYDTTISRWNNNQILSQNLKTELHSKIISSIGEVLYQGETAKVENTDITANVMVDEFKNDGASALYSYSTSREDLAMMVEESMMYHHFKYSRHTVFVKYPKKNFVVPEDFDYPIAGGIKNKIADQVVKERLQDVLEKMLEPDYSKSIMTSIDQLKPTDIPEGTDWNNINSL